MFWCNFLPYWRKSYLKTSITTPKLKILKIELFDPVTLDDLDLTKGRKRLRMVRRSIPETIHVVPPALFQFATAALPGESSKTDSKNQTFDPACDVISDAHIKFCNAFRKFKPGAIKYRFRIDSLSNCLTGRGVETPPPLAGKVWEYPIVARVKYRTRCTRKTSEGAYEVPPPPAKKRVK